MYEGICVDGPMDGLQGQSRFPEGFLLIDRPTDRVWIYDYLETNGDDWAFACRNGGEPLVLDHGKRWLAAESNEWDVRAYDDGQIPDGLEVGL